MGTRGVVKVVLKDHWKGVTVDTFTYPISRTSPEAWARRPGTSAAAPTSSEGLGGGSGVALQAGQPFVTLTQTRAPPGASTAVL